ncbi:MAG: hypothetical protein ACI4ML_12370 [Aristaeellaceae bacterium]
MPKHSAQTGRAQQRTYDQPQRPDRGSRAQRMVGVLLFVSLALSVIYAAVQFYRAPWSIPEHAPHEKVKSDYLLMLTQCILGLVVMALPSMVNRRWSVPIPRRIYIIYYIFLYCAIFLGEVFDFYYILPHWDIILHGFSGMMLSALGFILVDLLNRNAEVRVSLSPFFESMFAFCFALALGAIWEIYEFSFDALLGLNMQKALLEDGTALIGREALADTMEDLIVDAVAALAVAIAGYRINRQKKTGRRSGEACATEGRA